MDFSNTLRRDQDGIYTTKLGQNFGSCDSYETADTQNTAATTANYFATVANDLAVGDTILVYSTTDGTWVTYGVLVIVYGATPTVTIGNLGGNLLAEGFLTPAQFDGMYAAPFQLIAAPGANRVIVVSNATLSIIWNSVQYTAGGAIRFQYANTVHGAGTNAMATTVAAADVNAATANNFQLLLGVAQAWGLNTALGNQGIFLSNDTAAFATGNSNIKYSISYRVANLV